MKVTPWKTENINENGYSDLINRFGVTPITQDLIGKFVEITKMPINIWIERGLIFSHRDFDLFLEHYKKGNPIYIYTGRGPSGKMHLGHMIPFIMTKWLQEVFDCHVVVQMSDDEKYLFGNDLELSEIEKIMNDNIKDILAFGFNPKKTFIFSNLKYRSQSLNYNINILKLMKYISVNKTNKIFGFDENSSIGRVQWPAHEIAPCIPSSFPHLFDNCANNDIMCLIPCAIDQDPYFLLARDIVEKLGVKKPVLLHAKFLIGLEGPESKSSSSKPKSCVYLDDTVQTMTRKINKAYSGGGDTIELHAKHGANLQVDVGYQWLKYFMFDNDILAKITLEYGKGTMMTGKVKKYLIDILQKVLEEHQCAKSNITHIVLSKIMENCSYL